MTEKIGKVLVIGGGIAGMEASLNLVEAGYRVSLVDERPNIGGTMAKLDKTFPTNDCSMCIMAPKLVEVGRNPNIELFMSSEVIGLEGIPGNFTVTLRRRPRRVITDKCTSCGLCASNCPMEVSSDYNEAMSLRSAAYINFPQAVPSTYMIDRKIAPCIYHCPIQLNARDYVGLIAEGKFLDALDLIRERLPFPGIIGRICHHPCEDRCLRGRKVDQPIAICALKRFVADYEIGKREIPVPAIEKERNESIAIIGGGPAGLTCAIELRKMGFKVTIFEVHDKLGGMLYLGIPPYRLPDAILEREVSIIERMGIEVKYNTRVGEAISIGEILNHYNALFLSPGAHGKRTLSIMHEDAEGVLNGIEFLQRINKKEKVRLGNRVVIVGGGNVAIDVALTAKRYGAREIHMVCLETWDEMPAFRAEIHQALEEGIRIHTSWGPKEILLSPQGSVKGIIFKECISVFDGEGKFNPSYEESSTKEFEADTVILAIGQAVDTDFLKAIEGIERHHDGRIKVDPITFETTVKGIFSGGDAVTGPKTAIDAIAQGREAAESIRRYLEGKDLTEGRLSNEDSPVEDIPSFLEKRARIPLPCIALEERQGFKEVYQRLNEEAVRAEAERCLNCRACLGCKICEEVCKPEAIDYTEGPSEERLQVGSIVIACGFEEYDAHGRKEFGYGIYKNVVTSIEFERILSATGPTGGIIMRPSDGKIPEKIGFIQCVGSRDKTNEYCSSICCMYATKEAVIAKEHVHDIDVAIFYIDIRAFGKGFDQYVERTKKESGVRYIKSSISRVIEDIETRDLKVVYIDDKGLIKTESFDMLVLSVGVRPSKGLARLAETLNVKVNQYGFIEGDRVHPLFTSREGVFVCGACESPQDIPETVTAACGAACEAGALIASARGKELICKKLPEEIDVSLEEPRIGVFVCNCGINIGGIVNVQEVQAYARTLPNVVLADENLFTCSQDTQEKMKRLIMEYRINRVVVASCSPRTHEPLFRTTIQEAGLNKYLFEMANIREQCSWVHMAEKEDATEKAKTLVRMAVMNASHIRPLKERAIAIDKRALIVGGGIAGMTSALKLAEQGFEIFLIEKEGYLGGNMRHIFHTLDGMDVQTFLHETIERLTHHPLIHVFTNAEIKDHSGVKGNFETGIWTGEKKEYRKIKHGVIIVATGGKELTPTGYYGYGEDIRVMTQLKLEKRMVEGTLNSCTRCVMIQCIGSRNEERPYCSRVCCATAIKNSIALKEKDPNMDVVIIYRDIRTYGFLEKYYQKARRLGVRFIRYDPSMPPELERREDMLHITCFDPSIMETLSFTTDLLILSSAVIPQETQGLATILKVPRTEDGFFLEAHMKLRPLDFASDGMFLCGVAHGPKNIRETIIQAEGAAARALTLLSRDSVAVGGVVAHVDTDKCAACLTCVRLCPYGVPRINEKGEAEIDEMTCKGCGICAAECPAKAIDLMHYRDIQIEEKVRALCTK